MKIRAIRFEVDGEGVFRHPSTGLFTVCEWASRNLGDEAEDQLFRLYERLPMPQDSNVHPKCGDRFFFTEFGYEEFKNLVDFFEGFFNSLGKKVEKIDELLDLNEVVLVDMFQIMVPKETYETHFRGRQSA